MAELSALKLILAADPEVRQVLFENSSKNIISQLIKLFRETTFTPDEIDIVISNYSLISNFINKPGTLKSKLKILGKIDDQVYKILSNHA